MKKKVNISYTQIYDEWNKLKIDIRKKILIFVILRYNEVLSKPPSPSLDRLARSSEKSLFNLCRELEKDVGIHTMV